MEILRKRCENCQPEAKPRLTTHRMRKIPVKDLNTQIWIKPNATGLVPLGRRSHSAFVYNKQLYVFGGYNSNMDRHLNDLYCYNPELNCWSVVTARGVPPSPRRRQVGLVIDKRMYLFGGTDSLLDYGDIHVLDFESKTAEIN